MGDRKTNISAGHSALMSAGRTAADTDVIIEAERGRSVHAARARTSHWYVDERERREQEKKPQSPEEEEACVCATGAPPPPHLAP